MLIFTFSRIAQAFQPLFIFGPEGAGLRPREALRLPRDFSRTLILYIFIKAAFILF